MKIFLLILMTLFSASAFAQLHKWVDADGKVIYSDQPPPANVEATVLRSKSGTPDASEAAGDAVSGDEAVAPKTIAEREAELKKALQEKKEAADRAAQERAEVEAGQADCIALRKNLGMLQEGMRMMEIDENGERYYLSEGQRQQRIARTQQDISTHCK